MADCHHVFGHPDLDDGQCLPCESPHYAEYETGGLDLAIHVADSGDIEWTNNHPWDRIVGAEPPSVRDQVVGRIDYDGEAVSGYHIATLHTDDGVAVLTGEGRAVLVVVEQLHRALLERTTE